MMTSHLNHHLQPLISRATKHAQNMGGVVTSNAEGILMLSFTAHEALAPNLKQGEPELLISRAGREDCAACGATWMRVSCEYRWGNKSQC